MFLKIILICNQLCISWLAAWYGSSVVRRMNEVTLHWAQLVLEWVTVFGRVYHTGM